MLLDVTTALVVWISIFMVIVKESLLTLPLPHVTTTSDRVNFWRLINALMLFTTLLNQRQKMEIFSILASNRTSLNFFPWFSITSVRRALSTTGKPQQSSCLSHNLDIYSTRLMLTCPRTTQLRLLNFSEINSPSGTGSFKEDMTTLLTIKVSEIGSKTSLTLSKETPSEKLPLRYCLCYLGYCHWGKDCRILQGRQAGRLLLNFGCRTPCIPWHPSDLSTPFQELDRILFDCWGWEEYIYRVILNQFMVIYNSNCHIISYNIKWRLSFRP